MIGIEEISFSLDRCGGHDVVAFLRGFCLALLSSHVS